tara:strand:+ start:365 stop:2692 length:2328 start_codon:yes stop_codon:yes gene_type:complete
MFEPSLGLLILKTIFIFVVSTLCGWSIVYKRPTNIIWVNWVVFAVIGTTLLYLASLWSMLIGLPGLPGFLFVACLVVVKLVFVLRKKPEILSFTQQNLKSLLVPIIFLSSLSSINYLMPFVTEGTSGFYSRGGGDHAGYLSISDWLTHRTIWDRPQPNELIPPEPNWEVKNWVSRNSSFPAKDFEPRILANQLIATHFMTFLPGSNEETYSAAVAFYNSMALWSTVALLILFFKREALWWPALAPLFLSNLIVYAATTHSIPYIFAITMINVTLLLYWIYSKEPLWQTDIQKYGNFLPLGLMHAALLAIYPHGFLMMLVFAVLMGMTCGSWDNFKRFLTLGLTSIIFAAAFANFLLLTNVPYIFKGIGFAGSWHGTEFHFLNILASYSGIIDFLQWFPNNGVLQKKSYIGFMGFLLLLSFAGKSYISIRPRAKPLMASLVLLPLAGVVYYFFRGQGTYQIVRFAELGHLYLLGLAGIAFSNIALQGKKYVWVAFAILLFFVLPEIKMRINSVQEVLSIDPVFGSEFRDVTALEGVQKVAALQNKPGGPANNPIAYYFGPGDGVDFAGGSVLLRNQYFMHARGNTSNSFLDKIVPGPNNTRAWEKQLLDRAILVIRPEGKVGIIKDLRTSAFSKPLLFDKRLKIFDSREQPLTQLVGDSWHTLNFYPNKVAKHKNAYRLFLGHTAALVIWSQKKQEIVLSFFMNALKDESKVRFESTLFSEKTKIFDVPLWKGKVPDSSAIDLKLKLKPGANIITLTSQRDEDSPPWFYVWKVRIK